MSPCQIYFLSEPPSKGDYSLFISWMWCEQGAKSAQLDSLHVFAYEALTQYCKATNDTYSIILPLYTIAAITGSIYRSHHWWLQTTILSSCEVIAVIDDWSCPMLMPSVLILIFKGMDSCRFHKMPNASSLSGRDLNCLRCLCPFAFLLDCPLKR